MLIKTIISPSYPEPELHVCSSELNREVKTILNELHSLYDDRLTGTDRRGDRCLFSPASMISFYAEGKKVTALGDGESYTVAQKLYELEERLSGCGFVRISKSEIINARRIRKLDMSLTGTIRILMQNGYETYASRRNVARLKELLMRKNGIGGNAG